MKLYFSSASTKYTSRGLFISNRFLCVSKEANWTAAATNAPPSKRVPSLDAGIPTVSAKSRVATLHLSATNASSITRANGDLISLPFWPTLGLVGDCLTGCQ